MLPSASFPCPLPLSLLVLSSSESQVQTLRQSCNTPPLFDSSSREQPRKATSHPQELLHHAPSARELTGPRSTTEMPAQVKLFCQGLRCSAGATAFSLGFGHSCSHFSPFNFASFVLSRNQRADACIPYRESGQTSPTGLTKKEFFFFLLCCLIP